MIGAAINAVIDVTLITGMIGAVGGILTGAATAWAIVARSKRATKAMLAAHRRRARSDALQQASLFNDRVLNHDARLRGELLDTNARLTWCEEERAALRGWANYASAKLGIDPPPIPALPPLRHSPVPALPAVDQLGFVHRTNETHGVLLEEEAERLKPPSAKEHEEKASKGSEKEEGHVRQPAAD